MDAIQRAKVEAQYNLPNGVGIVKLVGRSAGFIADHASISSLGIDLSFGFISAVEAALDAI